MCLRILPARARNAPGTRPEQRPRARGQIVGAGSARFYNKISSFHLVDMPNSLSPTLATVAIGFADVILTLLTNA